MFPNPTNCFVHHWAGKYPGKIGALYSPSYWSKPRFYFPYVLDNGCYTNWQPQEWVMMLYKAWKCHHPLWAVVPDVVGDAAATMEMWHEWFPIVGAYGFNLAFVAQDGLEPKDVPKNAVACFIGGTTEWKLENAHRFKGVCSWLHVGRVNTIDRLLWAEEIGADSIDGTGWFRGSVNNPKNKQFKDLFRYLEGFEWVP